MWLAVILASYCLPDQIQDSVDSLQSAQWLLPVLHITDLLHIKPPGRYAMRSDDQHLLLVPRTKCKTFGDRAFAVAGPKVWNSLPLAVRNSVNVDTFKTNLKSFLFTQAYKHII